jgi:hypothetical protein
MRIAMQSPSIKAAEKADSAFAESEFAEKLARHGFPKVGMSCEFGDVRKHWFDEYIKNGGEFVEVCGVRFAPFRAESVVAQVADHVFYSRHPELKSRPLSLNDDDRDLRSEWMDLYVEFGGRVAEICS